MTGREKDSKIDKWLAEPFPIIYGESKPFPWSTFDTIAIALTTILSKRGFTWRLETGLYLDDNKVIFTIWDDPDDEFVSQACHDTIAAAIVDAILALPERKD